MPTWKYSGFGSGLIAFLLGTVAAVDVVEAQTAGSVGAVNSNATGTPPGKPAKALGVGQAVLQNERLQTDDNGTTQIIFDDRSALNVGRNSSVVIDHFVYNPSAGAGEMSLSLARGAARFVGGQVSHTSGATINTPTATIGVRGGNVTVLHDQHSGKGATTIMVHNGIVIVSNAYGSQSIRSGFQLVVLADQPPGTPTPIDMDRLRHATRQLASQGSQHGGAVTIPTDSLAARHNIGASRAHARTPNFDLPAAGDDAVRSYTNTRNQAIYP
jgi:hypothetical protein